MSEHGEVFNLDIKSLSDEGKIEGYASYFGNVDQGGDVIVKGAFAETLGYRPAPRVKMLMHHDMRRPVGVWDSMIEDGKGLLARGQILLQTNEGKEAYQFLKAGAIDGLSIGYRTIEDKWDANKNARKIIKVDLLEVSLVTMPMNERARINAVKSVEELTRRDLEAILRDAGYSANDAKTAAARYAEPQQRDVADDGLDELTALLRKQIETLKMHQL